MRVLFISFIILLSSCASQSTPFGRDISLGVDNKTYISAKGNVEIDTKKGTMKADQLLYIDRQNESNSTSKAIGLGQIVKSIFTIFSSI